MDIVILPSYHQTAGDCSTQTMRMKQFQKNEVSVPEPAKEEQKQNAPKDYSLYQWNTDGEMKFSIFKADSYSVENPILQIRGIDKNGNDFEQMINPKEVDPENAAFVEFSALCVWLSQCEEYDIFHFDYPECIGDDIFEKHDYLTAIRDKRDEQIEYGDMAAYHNSLTICSLISNFLLEKNGKAEYNETEYGRKRVYLIDISTKSSSLYSGGLGETVEGAHFHSLYADDSTKENPIVEVHVTRDGTDKEEIYRVSINDVDPTRATQMEMFALCSHYDRQKRGNPSLVDFSYYSGFINGLFCASTVTEFVSVKYNWCEKIEELSNQAFIPAAADKSWISIFKELFEAYLDKQDFKSKNEEISAEALQRLFEDRIYLETEPEGCPPVQS